MDRTNSDLRLVISLNLVAFIIYIFHSLFLYDYARNSLFVILSIVFIIFVFASKFLLQQKEYCSAVYLHLVVFYLYIITGFLLNHSLALPFIFLLVISIFVLSFIAGSSQIYIITVFLTLVMLYIHFYIYKFANFSTLLIIFASSVFLGSYVKHIIKSFHDKIEELSTTDDFTGLLNQKGFFRKLEEEYYRSTRYDKNFVLLMLDSDDLKRINDNYGHKYGSMVIKMISDVIKDNIRRTDFSCRYGGDEFMLCLVETDKDGGCVIADRLRSTIELNSLFTDKGKDFKITVSVGVSAYPDSGDRLYDIIDKADRALYQAKKDGKNKVKVLTIN